MTHDHHHRHAEQRVVKGNEAIRKQREAASTPTSSSITGVVRIMAAPPGDVPGLHAAEIPVRLDVRAPIDQGGRDQGDGSLTLTFTAERRADWRHDHGQAFRLDAAAVKALAKELEQGGDAAKPKSTESGA